MFLGAAACGESRPPPQAAQRDDGVPANSLSDARLHGTETPEERAAREERRDPTQPYTTKLGQAPPSAAGAAPKPLGSGTTAATDPDPSKPAASSSASAKKEDKTVVERSDCERMMDRYLELEIAKNAQLKDVPHEVIEQAKQMARQQHGEAPCTATRAQYTCAMAASSTSAWQRCLK
jgi:hypothetical protein